MIFAASLATAWLLGRFCSPAFAFIYSRGYSRDTLWGHLMLASGLSAMAACLPAALLVWSGLRSLLQDRLFQSPYFPLMAPCENWVPLAWLAFYAPLMLTFHYVWIRAAQPTEGGKAGIYVSLVLLPMVFAAFILVGYLPDYTISHLPAHVLLPLGGAYVLVLPTVALGGRALHRWLEVRA